jgi:hypothetical protein
VEKLKGETQKKKPGGIVLLKDLAPKKEVKGGAGKIVFGTGADPFFKEDDDKKPRKK